MSFYNQIQLIYNKFKYLLNYNDYFNNHIYKNNIINILILITNIYKKNKNINNIIDILLKNNFSLIFKEYKESTEYIKYHEYKDVVNNIFNIYDYNLFKIKLENKKIVNIEININDIKYNIYIYNFYIKNDTSDELIIKNEIMIKKIYNKFNFKIYKYNYLFNNIKKIYFTNNYSINNYSIKFNNPISISIYDGLIEYFNKPRMGGIKIIQNPDFLLYINILLHKYRSSIIIQSYLNKINKLFINNNITIYKYIIILKDTNVKLYSLIIYTIKKIINNKINIFNNRFKIIYKNNYKLYNIYRYLYNDINYIYKQKDNLLQINLNSKIKYII